MDLNIKIIREALDDRQIACLRKPETDTTINRFVLTSMGLLREILTYSNGLPISKFKRTPLGEAIIDALGPAKADAND